MANYLQLTNRVLNELNEVELTSSNFGSSRGVQTMVKNVVNKSIHDIYNAEVEWAYLYKSKEQSTTAGTRLYAYPSDARKLNFNSFVLTPQNLITNGDFTNNLSDWDTVSGSPFHTKARGDGAVRLNAAEVTQDVSTVINKEYIVRTRTFGGDISLQIGTSSGGAEISTTTLSIDNLGDGEYNTTKFTASNTVVTHSPASEISSGATTFTVADASNLSTGMVVSGDGIATGTVISGISSNTITINIATTAIIATSKTLTFTDVATTIYIGLANSVASNYDIDTIEVVENIQPQRLVYLSYNEWLDTHSETDLNVTMSSQFGTPIYVYRDPSNGSFGLSPIPDKSAYNIAFDYYATHTDLDAHGDTPTLPTRFHDIVVNRAKYYAYMMRANMAGAQLADKDYLEGIKRMRVELINHQSYFYPAGLRGNTRNFVGVNN